MVRYQLEDAEQWLEQRGARLERRPGKGIWIVYRSASREGLLQELAAPQELENKLAENERLRLMRLTFLAEARPQTSQGLGDYLGVSKTTVAKDLKRAREWFSKHGLYLKGTPGVGLNLVGDEMSWRKAMADAIVEGGTEQDFIRLFRQVQLGRDQALFAGGLLHALSDVDLHAVYNALASLERSMNLSFTDAARTSLMIHLAVTAKRLRVGRPVHISPQQTEYLRSKREYGQAKRFAETLTAERAIEIPDSEVAFITMHILGTKTRDETGTERFEPDPDLPGFDPKSVARKIAAVAEALLDQSISDEHLVSGLATHLTPVFYRLRFGLPIRNPMLEEIKARHKRVYDVAAVASEQFLLTAGMTLPEEEIGFVAMHIGAALERSREQRERPRIFVVCASGVSSASMLASRLRSEFPELDVSRTMSLAELQASTDAADLIISSVPVDSKSTPSVVVSPLLPEEDIERIRTAIFTYGIMRRERGATRARASASAQPRRQTREGVSRFADLLAPPGCISLGDEAKDWQEAITIAGGLLQKKGICTSDYISAMIRAVRDFGPYIVVARGIALPHASPSQGVEKPGASLVRLASPVEFGHPYNDPVSVIIALAVPGRDAMGELLEDLTASLLDPRIRESLRVAASRDEVLKAFRSAGSGS
ncbi:MAG: BglG family transcription antiterminator [Bacillota bacterium]|nr:BglG family transcription antiterminator [Bacillota bacterium]